MTSRPAATVNASSSSAPTPGARLVLHYTGSDDDRGGVMSVVRALATAQRFMCLLGVNPGFVQRRTPPLATLELPRIEGEVIAPRTLWRARAVAHAVHAWLREDPTRVFHGHSRTGLLVALWLARWGERRVVVSVHCYGRQRWFYRWASRQLNGRLYWLSPAMKHYYGIEGDSWTQCIPGCVPAPTNAPRARRALPASVIRLGGVGALVDWKRWHLIVDAVGRLPEALRKRVKFLHAGAPGASPEAQRYAADLRARTAAPEFAGMFEWRGEQPSADALLADLDCLIVASHHEPFSIAVLEALAAGVPVLAADTGGAQDLLVPGETGWLFRSGDAAELARAISALLETDALARVKISAETIRPFTAPVIAARWVDVYAAL